MSEMMWNDALDRSLVSRFKRMAKQVPAQTALVFQDRQYSYEQLDEMTDALAQQLQEMQIGSGKVVSILIPRCEYMLIASLGVLKSGACYQPLDAGHPYERIRYMMEDASSSLVIVSRELEPLLRDSSVPRLYMEDISKLTVARNFRLPDILPEDLFVLLYTSGSTGVPKGCMLEHKNLVSFAKWYISYYEADTGCRMAEHASFVFDVSMMELFMPLMAGATVYIVPEEIRTDLKKLNEFFEENVITHTSITTQLGRQFVENIENHSLRHLTVAGEALVPVQPPRQYRLHNGYGPTEGTILLTIQPVDRYYEGGVPIGTPLDDVEVYILNSENQQVQPGEMGELCAAGPHISRGYLNQPEQTGKVFEKNPFSTKEGYEWMYHTGDIVCYNQEGILEYRGRADRQVKIRGYRIELPEIEAAIRQCEQITDATVSVLEAGEEKYLVAYYVSEEELPEELLRETIGATKPSYMIPSYFVPMEEIPLNTNGKVDRTRLPEPSRTTGRGAFEEPKTEVEQKIAGLYEQLLGIDRVGRGDHFLMLGGHSLLATKLLFRLEQEYTCHLSMKTLLETPVVKDLAEVIEQIREGGGEDSRDLSRWKTIEPVTDTKEVAGACCYPASASQKRMFAAQQVSEKEDISYNLPLILHIEKGSNTISPEEIKKSIREMMVRHESLRTELFLTDGELLQKVYLPTEEWLDVAVQNSYIELDKHGWSDTERRRAFVQPFSMETAPLFRWGYAETEKEIQVYMDWHHSISDGTSMQLFCKEFFALCTGETVDVPALQYRDYAVWEQQQDLENDKKLWAQHLGGEVPVLDITSDYARQTNHKHQGAHYSIALSKDESQKVREFCKKNAITDYMCLFAGYFILLQRYTRQTDIVVGTVMSGRTRKELESMQGMFANTVPVQAAVKEEKSFLAFVKQIKEEILFAYEYQNCPLEEISKEMGASRTPSGNLLFDVLFVMQGFERIISGTNGAKARMEFVPTETAMYDLTVETEYDEEQYKFDFEYNMDVFAQSSIQWMAKHFIKLILSCVMAPEREIGELSFVLEREQQILRNEFCGETRTYQAYTVVERLEKNARENPEKTAVIFGDETLSYAELHRGAMELAKRIGSQVKKDQFVVIYAERSLEMIFAIWGVLYAGGAYVPVSPEYPAERIRFIIEDCQPQFILTCKAKLPKEIEEHVNVPVYDVDREQLNIEQESAWDNTISGEQLAYVIYTSGTTGKPKGVMVEHAQLAHLLEVYTDIYELKDTDCVLQFANFVFDQSVWDIFHILVVEGTLCLIPQEYVKDPEALEAYCCEKQVTAASLTPGFLRLLHPENMPTLRLLDVGGEAPSQELLKAWSGSRKVLNTYGPTETTVNATSFVFDGKNRGSSNVPIGTAIPNTQIFILQGEKLAGIGVPGELCIVGNGVTRGYLGRDKLTAEKYVDNPFGPGRMYRSGDLARYLPDGNIEFLGRMDEQVKVRGYRIELGEIESQMMATPYVKEAVVLVKKNQNGEAMLCGYYTAKEPGSRQQLMEMLQNQLPYYMVPSVLMLLDKIPLTVNGKIDKRALPEPELTSHREYIAPQTEAERECVAIWEEVLGVSPIGTTDEFFALGGDSIKAIRIVSRLRELGYRLEIQEVLLRKNIQMLVRNMSRGQEEAVYEEKKEILFTPVIQSFFEADMPHPQQFNQSVLLQFHEKWEERAIQQALEALICYHGMLRLQWNHSDQRDELIVREYAELPQLRWDFEICKNIEDRLRLCEKQQESICPREGRSFCVLPMVQEDTGAYYVLVVIHHLSVDEVSWGILLEDLNCLYREAKKRDIKPEDAFGILPARTISYGEWAGLQEEYRHEKCFEPERIYWDEAFEMAEQASVALQYFEITPEPQKKFVTVKQRISKDVMERVMTLSKEKYRTQPDRLLLAALMQAVKKLTGENCIAVQMESHGRGTIHRQVRTDRTLGWFTAVYPIQLEYRKQQNEQIMLCKERLDSVPNEGIGYGLLQQERGLPFMSPGFVFNYLGTDANTDYGEFVRTTEESGKEIHPENGDDRTITWNIRADESGFEVECCYDCCFDGHKMNLLLQQFQKALGGLAQDVSRNEEMCPMTPLQQGMLFHWMSDPHATAYGIMDEVTFDGAWDAACFQDALTLITEKYDSLRSRFCYEGMEQPWQIISQEIRTDFSVISDKSFEEIVAWERERGFDLTKDVLLRIYAFPQEGETMRLLVSQHHIITDGWSFPVMLDSLERYYHLLCQGKEFEEVRQQMLREKAGICSFTEYVDWLGKGNQKAGRKYWKQYLEEYDNGVGVDPYWRPKDGVTGEEAVSWRLPDSLTDALEQTSVRLGVTMSVMFETAWGILLQRENNCRDVVFGKTVSGRNTGLSGMEEAVGPFINTIPVRVNVDDDDITLEQLLQKQQKDAVQSMPYERISLAEIQQQCAAGNALVQTLFVYENYYVKEDESRTFTVHTLQEETNYDLSVCVEENDGLEVALIWNKKRYENEQMQTLLLRYKHIISQIAFSGEMAVSALKRIPDSERENLARFITGGTKAYPKKNIVEMLSETAKNNPDKIAVCCQGKTLTYSQLHRASSRLAEQIGFSGERYVAIVAERSVELVVALCGTLYAGAAYVPMDPEVPLERIRYMMEDCAPACILTNLYNTRRRDSDMSELCSWLANQGRPVLTVTLDSLLEQNQGSEDNVRQFVKQNREALWEQAAYVIYTSGTTGTPKGVVIEHKSLSNMIYSNEEFYGFCQEDNVLQMANYVFDQSVMDFFNTLAAGGTLYLITKPEMETAEQIEAYCVRNDISVIITTSVMLSTLHPERLPSLRLVDAGGDVAKEEIFDSFTDAARISNSYGPTETTVNATAFCYYDREQGATPNKYRSVPIGRPLTNKNLYVLQGDALCGVGMKGEICISGEGLAREYLNQRELTERQFVAHPYEEGRLYRTGDVGRYLPDGNLEFCGRIDDQVKIRGYRIELGEVEQRFRELADVSEVAVACFEDENGNNYLSGFLVSEKQLDLQEIRKEIQRKIPGYMVPSHLQQLDHLPMNQSGKLDVNWLREHQVVSEKEYEAPQNAWECLVADAFQKILHLSAVGRQDSFFDLGGSSIDIMKLVSALSPYEIQVNDIMKAPTPEELGALLTERKESGEKEHGFVVLRQGDATYPAVFCLPPSGGTTLCYYDLLREWNYPGMVYGMNDMKYEEYATLTEEEMWKFAETDHNRWEETLSAYEQEIVKKWKDGDILMGYSQGGSIALFLGTGLECQGHRVGAMIMLESEPFTGERVQESDEIAETLATVLQMHTGTLPGDSIRYPWEECQVKDFLVQWGKRNGEDDMKTLLQKYLVVRDNVRHPLVTEGDVSCPVYSIHINTPENLWNCYTKGMCKHFEVSADEGEHLVFLSKYKKEIVGILNQLNLYER